MYIIYASSQRALFSLLIQCRVNGTSQGVTSLGRRSALIIMRIRLETLIVGLTFLSLFDERMDFLSSYGTQGLTSTTNTTANHDKSENPWNRHFALLHPDNKTRCTAVSMPNVYTI